MPANQYNTNFLTNDAITSPRRNSKFYTNTPNHKYEGQNRAMSIKKKKKLPKSFKSHESQMKPLIAKLNQVSSYTFQARYALSNPHFISLLMYIFYIYKYIHLSII